MEGETTLQKLQGMFAFVIWDCVAKRAFVARDPYGIRPLYYAQHSNGVLFASQVKALIAEASKNSLSHEIIARRKSGFGIPVGRWLASANSGKVSGGSQGWARELVHQYGASLS